MAYYWDELGQFVPAALDIVQRGLWVPASTVPNVHPPAVMAWLALAWSVFGYSIEATRAAMLLLASACVCVAFLLAIELSRGSKGAPAFAAVLFLLVSPLFYTQAMLAQLDMPAMLFTCWALLCFLQGRIVAAAVLSVALVLVKETGIVVPAVFAAWSWSEGRRREVWWFLLPLAALGGWLVVLASTTGHVFGNSEFTDYNLFYPLHPVRLGIALLRRAFYFFVADFHWIGWILVALAWRKRIFKTRAWRISGSLAVCQVIVVTVLGGATLERYLLPVLPLMYIAFAASAAALSKRALVGQAALIAGLTLSIFWNPPYPVPHDNNLAMVDFVNLHQRAAAFLETNYRDSTVATAWPFSAALRRPEFGYVRRPAKVRRVPGFQASDLATAAPFELFVLYSREWEPPLDLRRMPFLRGFMKRMYGYEPQVTSRELETRLGVREIARWSARGQWVAIFSARNSIK